MERKQRMEARQKELALAEQQQEELLSQIDALLKKKNTAPAAEPSAARVPQFDPQDYPDRERGGSFDDEDDDMDEELENWLKSLPEKDSEDET